MTAQSSLDGYKAAWKTKPLLRRVYNDIYDRIAACRVGGLTVEIGGGIGQFRQRFPDIVSTDIQAAPWLDLVADAQHLPFADGTVSNIVMLDVLHHIQYPLLFLREAERVLCSGGRCIMVEPGITWGSTLFYRFIHHEPVRMRDDTLALGTPEAGRDPYDSNQAIPTLLVSRDRARMESLIPGLRIERVDWFSFAAYPLSGGFKSWSLIPDNWGAALLVLERKIEKILGPALAFRMLIVLERK